jgi:ParB-like chromosome segregation protein Spo0J
MGRVKGNISCNVPAGLATRPLASLVPAARNARTHSPEQVAAIAASIVEFGFNNPVLIDAAGGIVAGHGRVLAAQRLGLDAVPVVVLGHLTEVQRRAYLLADNRLAELAGWDKVVLAAELEALASLDVDLGALGFTAADLAALTAPDVDPFAEWEGMPEFQQNSKVAYQTIAVHLKDAEAATAFARLIGQPITQKTRFIWYPQAEIERYVDKRYTTAEAPE